MKIPAFDYFVFYANIELILASLDAGASGVIVDWEDAGKGERQKAYDTQINRHGDADLALLRKRCADAHIICRVNGDTHLQADEIRRAIDLGANEVLIPMVKSLDQLDLACSVGAGQVQISAMIETVEAVALAESIATYPLQRVYVGLNDLSISRKLHGQIGTGIFAPMVDGTLEQIRPCFTMPFGIAGLTHPTLGSPYPCQWIINTLIKYDCDFSFMRRSFFNDLKHYSQKEIFTALNLAFSLRAYSEDDFQAFKNAVSAKSTS